VFEILRSTDGIALMRTEVFLLLNIQIIIFLFADGAPVYHPTSFNGPTELATAQESIWSTTGEVNRYNTKDDSNYDQPASFWEKVKMQNYFL